MTYLIPAVYEHGMIKVSTPLNFPDHQKLIVAVVSDTDNVPSLRISQLAEQSPSYHFLNSPQEDIYTRDDGKEI
jgi:hypothetical protein